MEIQTHCINLDEILHAHYHLFKEGFDAGLTPLPPLGLGRGLKLLNLKDKDVQQVAY